MEFDPKNNIVRLCILGMELEGNERPEEAATLFLKAWDESADSFEKYLSAYFVARHQKNITDRIEWLRKSLQLALEINDDKVKAAFPFLYMEISKCNEESGDSVNAKKNYELALSYPDKPTDSGPFYHGTRSDLQPGDLLTAGNRSNYKPGLIMNHIYFTASIYGAGLAASLSKGEGRERVYMVEPAADFENDPNVTNKKFPGNPTRSYRTKAPLKIIGEVSDWAKQTPEDLAKWREKLSNIKGDIIN